MTTDRELLELAARAAGYCIYSEGEDGIYWWGVPSQRHVLLWERGHGGCFRWNPLTHDGDAIGLAVKLSLSVVYHPVLKQAIVCTYYGYDEVVEDLENNDDDPYAATRRAIVRAAAEIGRSMK